MADRTQMAWTLGSEQLPSNKMAGCLRGKAARILARRATEIGSEAGTAGRVLARGARPSRDQASAGQQRLKQTCSDPDSSTPPPLLIPAIAYETRPST